MKAFARVAVALLSALVFALVLPAAANANASDEWMPHDALSVQAYDAPIHVYDAVANSGQVHVGAQDAVAGREVSEDASASTVSRATSLGPLAPISGFSVAATSALGATVTGVKAAAVDWAQVSGIVRDAARGKGNFGLGGGTAAEAASAGKAWVGGGARLASDGYGWVSLDGLRQWRPPS